MGIVIPALNESLSAIGNANVYITSDFEEGDWVAIGAKKGPIEANVSFRQNNLTADEQTGGIVHDQLIMLESVSITVPMLAVRDLDVQIASLGPVGGSGGGWSSPQSPDVYSVAIVPNLEAQPDGLTYDGTTWLPAAPRATFWLWRATIMHGPIRYQFDSGGEMIIDVTFTGMYYGPNPEGHKVYTIGDPTVVGIESLRINADS